MQYWFLPGFSFKSIQHSAPQGQQSSNLSESIRHFPCSGRGSYLEVLQFWALRLLRVATWRSRYWVSANTSLEWTRSLASRHGRVNHASKLSKGPALRISQCSKNSRKLRSAEAQSPCLRSAGWEHQGELPGKDYSYCYEYFGFSCQNCGHCRLWEHAWLHAVSCGD